MSRKYEAIEDLEAFAEKLSKTKETIIKMMEAPTNELIKFGAHGQWELTKGCDEQRAEIGEDVIAREKKKAEEKAEKGEGINGPGTGAGSSL